MEEGVERAAGSPKGGWPAGRMSAHGRTQGAAGEACPRVAREQLGAHMRVRGGATVSHEHFVMPDNRCSGPGATGGRACDGG